MGDATMLTPQQAAALLKWLRDLPYPNNPREYEEIRGAMQSLVILAKKATP